MHRSEKLMETIKIDVTFSIATHNEKSRFEPPLTSIISNFIVSNSTALYQFRFFSSMDVCDKVINFTASRNDAHIALIYHLPYTVFLPQIPTIGCIIKSIFKTSKINCITKPVCFSAGS